MRQLKLGSMNRQVPTRMRELYLSVAMGFAVTVFTSIWLLNGAESESNFFAAILLLGIPLFVVGAVTLIGDLPPGSLYGTVLGFCALCLLETYYEQRIFKGPNSMPGFAIIIWCAPATLIALLILCKVQSRWKFQHPILNFALGVLFVFGGPVSIPLISSVVL